MNLSIDEIIKFIPHRDPFLFVDTCEIIVPGEHGKSKKIFSENLFVFDFKLRTYSFSFNYFLNIYI